MKMNHKTILIFLMLTVANLVTAQHHDVIRVSCIGASITEGGLTDNPATDCYPAQLGRLLGDRYNVMNFGVSSSTMLRNGDFSYWTKGRLDEALKSEPDIVLIDLGGNDSKSINRDLLGEYVADACDMVALFQQLPTRPRVILMTPVVSFDMNPNGIYDPVIVNDVIPQVIIAAEKSGAELLDMHPVLAEHPELLSDGVHPNTIGSAMMACAIYGYLMNRPTEILHTSPNKCLQHK